MKNHKTEPRAQRRGARMLRLIWLYREDQAKRLAATRRLFGRPVHVVDIHSHSVFSDGLGTLEENRECARHAGLDFLFCTDHFGIRQKRVVAGWRDASWGQEPGAGPHHIGLLCNRRRFKPCCSDIARDFAAARQLAPFVWIPHPAGWYPSTWYPDEAIQTLWTLGRCFPMEVMNGACKAVRAYDAFDAKAVTVWDKLLSDGRQVTAVAGSDAHAPDDIGTAWTGIFAKACTPSRLIEALNKGTCFASEASLMDFTCNGKPMGSTVNCRPGAALRFRFRAADAAGVASVTLVSQGKAQKEFRPRRETVLDGVWTRPATRTPAYYRLEVIAADGLRAFSSPIYTQPR
jgi:hypothetical protein